MFIKKNNQIKNFYFMDLARRQAQYILGNTGTNPAVGCVIVKNGCIVSAASTSYNGRPHAEFNAINKIKRKAKDADLYVTLEPCSHYGKTPPCVRLIAKQKINRVFFSVKDIDPRSYNKSSNYFKKKSIKVKKGILYEKIHPFYESYFKYKKKELPFVTCKLAVSKDLYSKNNKKKWITNHFSRGRVHLLRSTHDCLITTYKTIKDDNPRLNCRIDGLAHRSPKLFILDKNLKTSLKSRIFSIRKNADITIFYNKNKKRKIKKLKNLKVKLVRLNLNYENKFNLKEILINVRNFGFSRIFVESGNNLIFDFFKYNLVNDFKLFISSNKIGKHGKNNIKNNINIYLKNKKYIIEKVNLFGDKLLNYRIK